MNSLYYFRKLPCNKSMGIEIETVICQNNGIEWATGKYKGFWYVTNDCSIRVPYAHVDREFVSQPLTPTWLKKEIKKLYSKIKWQFNETCGIHIHVGRTWLSEERAKAIYKFYCSLDIEQQETLFGRSSNDYCLTMPWKATRYNAINGRNSKTLEFRMFASGDAQWACYCVDMVCYLIANAKHLNVDAAMAFRDGWKYNHG